MSDVFQLVVVLLFTSFHLAIYKLVELALTKYSPLLKFIVESNGIVYNDVNSWPLSLYDID